jgi:3-methyladenine DNA glycosylase AlkD
MSQTPAWDRAEAILGELRSRSDPAALEGMARFGIQTEHAVGGIRVPELRAMARRIGRDHRMALALWSSGIHEACLLATMVDEPAAVTERQMESWARDFDSWDVVDGACINLFRLTPYGWAKAVAWSAREEEYVKRAGFALMAALAVHDKGASDAEFEALLPLIEGEAGDRRNLVRKAVSWALRQIGKRNATLNGAAVAAAERILASGVPSARWVASDALRELTGEAVRVRLRTSPPSSGDPGGD